MEARNWPFAAFTEESKRLFPSQPAAPVRIRAISETRKMNFASLYLFYAHLLYKFSLLSFPTPFFFSLQSADFISHSSLYLYIVGKEIYLFFVVARFANVEEREKVLLRARPSLFLGGGRRIQGFCIRFDCWCLCERVRRVWHFLWMCLLLIFL